MKHIEINSFSEIDFRDFKIPIITVYFNPKDFPNKYVARVFEVDTPTPYAIVRDTLREIHKAIPMPFTKLDRSLNDDPVIVEVWL